MTDTDDEIRKLENLVSVLQDAADLQKAFDGAVEKLLKLKQERSNADHIKLSEAGPASLMISLPRETTSYEEEILLFVAGGGEEGISGRKFREKFGAGVLGVEEDSGVDFLFRIRALMSEDYASRVALTEIGTALLRRASETAKFDLREQAMPFMKSEFKPVTINDPNGGRR